MTLTENRTVQIGIAGSLAVHVVLFVLLAWLWGVQAAARWMKRAAVVEEKQVTLLFAEQIIAVPAPAPAPPPPPKASPKPYIRTTQNQAAAAAPAKADFISDRNTLAASKKAAAPDGTEPLPTTDGIERPTMELVNRQFRDGETKSDAAPAAIPIAPQMRAPDPSIPQPADPPKPAEVAKAQPVSPMAKMMEEIDKDMARVDPGRLPIDVKKAETPDAPPKAEPSRTAAVAKAIPVDPITGKPLPNPEKRAFQPETHTSKVKGTISNRGEAAVNAAETPMGKYMRAVTAAVEKKWHLYRRQKADAVTPGELSLRFYVTKAGATEELEITSDRSKADPRMTDFTLQAIMDADIPPIPRDLLPVLERERIEIEYNVLIY